MLDKEFSRLEKVFIPIFNNRDKFLLSYAQNLNSSGSQITFYNAGENIDKEFHIREVIRLMEQNAPNHVHLSTKNIVEKEFLQDQNLMIISMENWKKLVETRSVWLANIPSVANSYEN